MRIGFKTSKHTGQQFLTFKRPRIVGFPVYSYTIGGQPYTPKSGQSIDATIGYADYSDFLTFSAAKYKMLTFAWNVYLAETKGISI